MSDSKHGSSTDPIKRTLLGVGLASLFGDQAGVPDAAPSVREPSIQVSGEIFYMPPTALRRELAKAASTAVDSVAHTDRRHEPEPTSREPRRRRKAAALAIIGALGLSIGVGLGARWLFSSTPAASDPTPIPASTGVPIRPTSIALAAVPVHPPAVSAPVAAPAPAPTPSRATPPVQLQQPEPRAVHLGDGSCALLVDSTVIGDVSVDDQPVGPTPILVSGLWCGSPMTVQITRRGFERWSKTIRTQEGRMSRIMAAPRRVPTKAPSVTAPVGTVSSPIVAPVGSSIGIAPPMSRSASGERGP